MKPVELLSVGAFLLLLGSVAPTYAQREPHQQDAKAAKQGHQAEPEKRPPQQPAQQSHVQQPHPQQEHAQQQHVQQPHQPAKAPQKRPQQAFGGVYHGGLRPNSPTYGGVHPSGVPQHQQQVRRGLLQSRARSWNNEHRTWQQRGGYTGYRVPDARFGLYFGRSHPFRINRLPVVFVGGYPRFQYDGYWVTFVDPWPEAWPPTWYETDDVYIDCTNDGYYIYDRMHPGIGIAVTISF